MSRTSHVFAVFAISGALAGATVAACGARPGSAGELPPTAPRPAPIDPSGAPAAGGPTGHGLGPTTAGSGDSPRDGGPNALSPGPVSSRLQRMPMPAYGGARYTIDEPDPEGVVGNQLPRDAGATSDGYTPPMQPLPDGGVPIDSRLEPR